MTPLHSLYPHPILAVTTLLGVVIEAAISVGGYFLSAALSRSDRHKPILLDQMDNPIAKGGFVPLVLGHRAVGPYITWAGFLFTEQVSNGSKSSAPATVYYACAMHVLTIGPMRRIYKIYANEHIIFDGLIDSGSSASGAAFVAGYFGQFQVYFGQLDQPANAFLSTQMGVTSAFPGIAYVLWQPYNLGPSANWPVFKYEIETHVSDMAASAGLDLTPVNNPDWIDESTPTDGFLTVWLNGGKPIPAGTYEVVYDGGALSYTGYYSQWNVLVPFAGTGIFLVDSSYAVVMDCPGNELSYASQEACEAANAGATSSTFTWGGGVLGLQFENTEYTTIIPGSPNPTYTVQAPSGLGPTYTASCIVEPGEPAVGDSGTNGIASLYLLLCAPFPWGCALSPALIDAGALANAAAQVAAEQLVSNLLITDGRDMGEVIGSLMSDIGMLMPQVGGILTPFLIRPDPSPIAVPNDAIDRSGITYDFQTDFFNPDRLTLLIKDVLFDFMTQDIHLDNDAQAFTDQRPKVETVNLETVTDRTTGYLVGNRKQLEVMTQAFRAESVKMMRSARNPSFHPGTAFTAQVNIGDSVITLPLRVAGWKPDGRGISAEIDIVLDQYGDASNSYVSSDATYLLASPGSATAGQTTGTFADLLVIPALQEPGQWPSSSQPTFVVPRLRASQSINACNVWASTSSSGPFSQVGTQNAWGFGGTLSAAITTVTDAEFAGPIFAGINNDSNAVLDLASDAGSFAAGAQRLFVPEASSGVSGTATVEQILCGYITAASGANNWMLSELQRGPYSEPPSLMGTIASGTSIIIAAEAQLTPIWTPLILQVQGSNLWIKTQPLVNGTPIDLSGVTAVALAVPPNLMGSITCYALYSTYQGNAMSFVVGPVIYISWSAVEVSQVDLYFSSDGGTTWSLLVANIPASYGIATSQMTPGTGYLFQLRDHSNASTFANSEAFDLTSNQPPTTPGTPTATPGSGQVSLAWTASTFGAGYTFAYDVLRGTASGGPYQQVATTGTNAYTDTGLTSGTTYYYVVTAWQVMGNDGGESAGSGEASATPT